MRTTTGVRATEALNCLVVATDSGRRENLGFAAREGGWHAHLCADARGATAQAKRTLMHMAIVDMTGADVGAVNEFRSVVEQLAMTHRTLLLICGNLEDRQEEIWARHLGVWMYLPGAIDGTDLVALCAAAHDTAERLVAASRPRLRAKEHS